MEGDTNRSSGRPAIADSRTVTLSSPGVVDPQPLGGLLSRRYLSRSASSSIHDIGNTLSELVGWSFSIPGWVKREEKHAPRKRQTMNLKSIPSTVERLMFKDQIEGTHPRFNASPTPINLDCLAASNAIRVSPSNLELDRTVMHPLTYTMENPAGRRAMGTNTTGSSPQLSVLLLHSIYALRTCTSTLLPS